MKAATLLALGVVVQTPGLSHVFGCTPLGPIAWSTALASTAAATFLAPTIDRGVDRVADLIARLRDGRQEPPLVRVFPRAVEGPSVDLAPHLRLLRN